MKRDRVRGAAIKALLRAALTNRAEGQLVYVRGLDTSYRFEGYGSYDAERLVSKGRAPLKERSERGILRDGGQRR